jgi:tRNA threonylcarbamoyl adenosine modification protein YeaZ/ribosomal-protein-alanine acetyltransferase
MSTILAIDTSTDRTSVAIVKDGVSLIEIHHDDALAHGEVLPKLVKQALEIENQIDSVGIGMGPGPFTGLRVGIAFGQSFALGRDIEWVGVSSLDAIAVNVDQSDFIVAIDARRQELFWARYFEGRRVTEPAVNVHQVVEELGVAIVRTPPRATEIAELAISQNLREPNYIRRPDAYPLPIGIIFRAATTMDAVPLYALEKEIYKGEDPWSLAQFKEEIAAKDRYYIVAEADGVVIGYAGIMPAGDLTDILTMTVAPEFRRKGIAREFLKRLIDWSRNKKAVAVMLEVRIDNAEAIPLYEANGFRKISERIDYYGPGKTALVMRKELRS